MAFTGLKPTMSPRVVDENVQRLILVYDPSDLYPRDHWFYRVSWQGTLEDGFWPTGSIWRAIVNEGSDFFVIVRGDECETQRAVQYKGKISHLLRNERPMKKRTKYYYGDPDARSNKRRRRSG